MVGICSLVEANDLQEDFLVRSSELALVFCAGGQRHIPLHSIDLTISAGCRLPD